MSITVKLPILVRISSRKEFALNLNIYRNAHYQVLNHAKKLFAAQITEEVTQMHTYLLRLPQYPKTFHITYTLYPSSKRKLDVANTCSIVDKFFCDSLVKTGVIPDDDFSVITQVTYCYGALDPKNPRVEATIIPTG